MLKQVMHDILKFWTKTDKPIAFWTLICEVTILIVMKSADCSLLHHVTHWDSWGFFLLRIKTMEVGTSLLLQ